MRNFFSMAALLANCFFCLCAYAVQGASVPNAGHLLKSEAVRAAWVDRGLPAVIDLAQHGDDLRPARMDIAVRDDTPPSLSVEQIIAQGSGLFKPFVADETYPLNSKRALWLHFRIAGNPAESFAGWTVGFSKPDIDRITLYHRNAAGRWEKQAAGDFVPHKDWPVQSLTPQFHLPPLLSGVNDFYVEVQQLIPVSFSVNLQRTSEVSRSNQNTFFMGGLALGFLGLTGILGLVLGIAYKNNVYRWYALYALTCFFLIACYLGIANYAFWPSANVWSDKSGATFLMAAMLAHVQFCRTMLVSHESPLWSRAAGRYIVIFGSLVTCLYVWVPMEEVVFRLILILAVFSTCALVVVMVAMENLDRRPLLARLWLLAYVPVICVAALVMIDLLGILPMPWLPNNASVYSLVYEMPILLIAMQIHIKSMDAQYVRENTLADVDPLTGFLAPRLYRDTFAKLWRQSRSESRDLSVVYINAAPLFPAGYVARSKDIEKSIMRSVRLLRTIGRKVDVVARIDTDLFAILMPGVSYGDQLKGLLSRLVAQGLTTDPDDPHSHPVRFRMAAGSLRRFPGTWIELDVALCKRLAEPDISGSRTISFLSN